MNKEKYLKPTIDIISLETGTQLLTSSFIPVGGSGKFDTKERREPQKEWGSLW